MVSVVALTTATVVTRLTIVQPMVPTQTMGEVVFQVSMGNPEFREESRAGSASAAKTRVRTHETVKVYETGKSHNTSLQTQVAQLFD